MQKILILITNNRLKIQVSFQERLLYWTVFKGQFFAIIKNNNGREI